MKRYLKIIPAIILTVSLFFSLAVRSAHAAFNANDLIDDSVFDNVNTMTAAQIDNWLNSNFGAASCISTLHGFSSVEPTGYNPTQGFLYGSPVSAGQVIYDAAHAYGINPQVLLATMQKEESLVTGSAGCSVLGDTSAMGYGCPDNSASWSYGYPTGPNGNLLTPLFYLNGSPVNGVNGTCVGGTDSNGNPVPSPAKAGFSQQVIHAAWLLAYSRQRSEGNVSWNVQLTNFPNPGNSWDNSDDPPSCYSGNMTQGYRARSTSASPCPNSNSPPGNQTFYYDGLAVIDGTSVHMDTGATASLYRYTPHFAGNQNFVDIFTGWFGNPTTPCYNSSNLSAVPTGQEVISNKYLYNQIDYLTLIMLNNTGSTCTEAHTWSTGEQSWMAHIATNLPVADPATSRVITGDLNGDGHDDLVLVKYLNTGSGKIEIHEWDPTYQRWAAHVATNLPSTDPSIGQVITFKMPGEKFTRFAYVKYLSTGSGRVEVHVWNTDQQSFLTDIATNVVSADQSTGQIIAANPFGEGFDRLAYVKYQNTASGMVEVHVWQLGEQSFINDFATNLLATSPDIGQVIAGDIYGEGRDRLMFVKYTGTGSGRVEVHVWNIGLTTWYTNIATNLLQF